MLCAAGMWLPYVTHGNKGDRMLRLTQRVSCCMGLCCNDSRRSHFYIKTGLFSLVSLDYKL